MSVRVELEPDELRDVIESLDYRRLAEDAKPAFMVVSTL